MINVLARGHDLFFEAHKISFETQFFADVRYHLLEFTVIIIEKPLIVFDLVVDELGLPVKGLCFVK